MSQKSKRLSFSCFMQQNSDSDVSSDGQVSHVVQKVQNKNKKGSKNVGNDFAITKKSKQKKQKVNSKQEKKEQRDQQSSSDAETPLNDFMNLYERGRNEVRVPQVKQNIMKDKDESRWKGILEEEEERVNRCDKVKKKRLVKIQKDNGNEDEKIQKINKAAKKQKQSVVIEKNQEKKEVNQDQKKPQSNNEKTKKVSQDQKKPQANNQKKKTKKKSKNGKKVELEMQEPLKQEKPKNDKKIKLSIQDNSKEEERINHQSKYPKGYYSIEQLEQPKVWLIDDKEKCKLIKRAFYRLQQFWLNKKLTEQIDMACLEKQLSQKREDCTKMLKKYCIICMDKQIAYIHNVCGHYCMCEDCKDIVNGVCPVCMSKGQFIKVYIPM